MSHILTPQDILRNSEKAGPKARALALLTEKGFHVPPFLALTADGTASVDADPAAAVRVAAEARERLPAQRYAVRSAAFSEDTAGSSRAGAFRTELDVPPEGLEEALRRVIDDARSKGETAFSVIIQQHIPPEISGVTFTRSPFGGREMRVEWHKGAGPALVEGKADPERAALHWSGRLPKTGLPDFAYAVREWKRIEEVTGFPQDIEWCVWKKDWYVLQARPVTTLTPADHAAARMLDKELPQGPFLYEKTEVTEMAPRPTAATLSLLRRIYAGGGPVERAYAQAGFRYRAADFLRTVGGQLYIDREAELKALLPSFSYFSASGKPSFRSIRGIATTMHNIAATQRLRPDALLHAHRMLVLRHLSEVRGPLGVRAALDQFGALYETVASVNIAAAKALTLLTRALKGEPVQPSLLLSSALTETEPLPLPPQGPVGNSLELSDLSPFFAMSPSPSAQHEATQWWNGLAAERRAELTPLLRTAQEYSALREAGRWLSVSLVHVLRDALLREAERLGLSRELAWDAPLEEYLAGKPDARACAARREERLAADGLRLPVRLSHLPESPAPSGPAGVSPGTATGMAVTPETIGAAQGPVILCVPTLSPDLTRHFGRIGGIVAEHGGLLSHLAIVARERRIPAVTGVSLAALGIRPGDVIDINGTRGEVRVLKKS